MWRLWVKEQVYAAVRTMYSLELEIVNQCCQKPHNVSLKIDGAELYFSFFKDICNATAMN